MSKERDKDQKLKESQKLGRLTDPESDAETSDTPPPPPPPPPPTDPGGGDLEGGR